MSRSSRMLCTFPVLLSQKWSYMFMDTGEISLSVYLSRQSFPIPSCPPRGQGQSCTACRLKSCPGGGTALSLSLMTKDRIKIEDDPWLNITESSQLTLRRAWAMGWLAALLSYVMYYVQAFAYFFSGCCHCCCHVWHQFLITHVDGGCEPLHRGQLVTVPVQDFPKRNGEHWNFCASSAGKW